MQHQKPDIPIQLPLAVPVGLNWALFFVINMPLMMIVTMVVLLTVGGIGLAAVNSPLEPFLEANPAILIAGAVVLLILPLIAVGLIFAWITPYLEAAACSGRLIIDKQQLKLSIGGTETVIRWDTACQVRRQGVFHWGRHRHHYFEMWELTQGSAQIVLSRKVSLRMYTQLTTRVRQRDVGQLVPIKPDQVFATIAQLGKLEYA